MLVALITNNQNVIVKLPTVKIDRGGGGARWPGYEIVDIVSALRAFPEVSGEHPVARAARRMRFVEEALPGIREAREAREGRAFLLGAEVGARAQADLHVEELPRVLAAYDAARAVMPSGRGAARSSAIGAGAAILLVGLGVGLGVALARRR